jgi:cyclase
MTTLPLPEVGRSADGTLLEVVPDTFAWIQPDGSWWVNNAGAICAAPGSGGDVLLVDTCATARRTRGFLAAVDRASGGGRLRYAVNTHMHGDHTYGNQLLPETTVVIAHERTRTDLLGQSAAILRETPKVWDPMPEWGVSAVRAPDVVAAADMTVFVGERRVDLRHPGHAAHTAGDLVAWLPEERVLFAGDLVFHGITPLVLMGSLAGARRSLEWLAAFDASAVVPGHGPLVARDAIGAVLAEHDAYYRLVEETARAGIAAGLTPRQAADTCDLGSFAHWPDAERLVLNLHRAYADMLSGEVDLALALRDAVSLRGGLLHCSV